MNEWMDRQMYVCANNWVCQRVERWINGRSGQTMSGWIRMVGLMEAWMIEFMVR